jgi:murein DD-endopeptidase MepM/ murein hydrolase activator NlpD
MAPKHWTIVIVPPGTATARTIHVGPRARRALLGGLAAAGLLVVSSVAVLFTPYAAPGARILAAQNARLQGQLDDIGKRLALLGDTLTALGARDQQIRLLAGLPSEPASGTAPAVAANDTGSAAGPSPASGPVSTRAAVDVMIQRASKLSADFSAVSDTLTRNLERLANTPSIMPTTGWLSSQFSLSRFHPILHENRPHEGIDLSAPMGAPIVAPASGRVISVGNEPGYGNTFQIDHGNGIVTKYAHCSRIVVHVGQHVTRGQLIATVGNTGLATGPHLHYEVHVNGKPVDPLKYVLPDKVAN